MRRRTELEPDYSAHKTQDNEVVVDVNSDQVNEQLASDSSVYQPAYSAHKTQDSEVTMHVKIVTK